MTIPLWHTSDPRCRERLNALKARLSLEEGLRRAGKSGEPPLEAVRRIMADVRERGDAAVLEHTERLDGCSLSPEQMLVSRDEVSRARERCPADLIEALELSAERVRQFQESILLHDPPPLEVGGRRLGIRYRPVDSAGICVPGAAASLASTVLMAAVPARVAGVERLCMVTAPRPDGTVSDDRLAAADIAGVHEVYRIGGVQAVAALAYGTETIRPVDFIAGPGNIYVTLAKKEVYGQVGIEMLPGPSEVVVIADETGNPGWIAADLIAQAEHNPGSAILLTPEQELARAVGRSLDNLLSTLPAADATRSCLESYGALIVAESLAECVELTNELAPEHLEIATEEPEAVASDIRHAGAIFLGPWTPESVGDYVAGPSHVLPTSRTARFSSGLSANDFLKRSSLIGYDAEALSEDADDVATLARAEGLEGHARAVEARRQEHGS
ncbi:MAG: histidinol dehydrogenase [Candidatus Brocadiia bacterium]